MSSRWACQDLARQKVLQGGSAAAEGLTAAAVGMRLIVSTRTVESHLASAYRKLAVNTREQAVRKFQRLRQAGLPTT